MDKKAMSPIKLIMAFVMIGAVGLILAFSYQGLLGKQFSFLDNSIDEYSEGLSQATSVFLSYETGELRAIHFEDKCWYCGSNRNLADSDYCSGDCCKGSCPGDGVILDVPYYNQCGLGTQAYCASACGPVSLKMGLSYYDNDRSIHTLYGDVGTTLDGSQLEPLADTATSYDVPSRSVTYPTKSSGWEGIFNELKKGSPVITLMRYSPRRETCASVAGHYVLVVGMTDEYVIVNDPYTGICAHESGNHMVLSKNYFLSSWNKRGLHAVLMNTDGGAVA